MLRFVDIIPGPLSGTVVTHPAVGSLVIVTDPAGAVVKVEWGDTMPDGLADAGDSIARHLLHSLESGGVIDVAPRDLTPISLAVVKAIAAIPHGKVLSYKELASKVGCHSVRAVATAVGRNPLPVIIPCHRVLPAAGAAAWRLNPARVLSTPKLLGHYTPLDALKYKLLAFETRFTQFNVKSQ